MNNQKVASINQQSKWLTKWLIALLLLALLTSVASSRLQAQHGGGHHVDPTDAIACGDYAVGENSPQTNNAQSYIDRPDGTFGSGCHPMGCQPGEIWTELHAWWLPNAGKTGEDFGHMHMNLCNPLGAGMQGSITWPIQFALFESPGDLRTLKATLVYGSKEPGYWKKIDDVDVPEENCTSWQDGNLTRRTCTPFWYRNSNGEPFTFDISGIPRTGHDRIRFRARLFEPDNSEVNVRTKFLINHGGEQTFQEIRNGKVQNEPAQSTNGWYGKPSANMHQYASLQIVNPPLTPILHGETYNFQFRRTKSNDEGALTPSNLSWYAAINFDSHVGEKGIPLCPQGTKDEDKMPMISCNSSSGNPITLTVNPAELGLEPGWHRLYIRHTIRPGHKGAFLSGNQAILFEVAEPGSNGPTPTPTPSPTPTVTPSPTTPPTSGNNLLADGGFEDGSSSWKFNAGDSSTFTVSAPGSNSGQAGHVAIVGGSNNIQLYQKGLTIKPNTDYVLTFDGYSSSGTDLRVELLNHKSPYTNYGLHQTLNLGTDWQQHQIAFTTDNFGGTVNNARFRFWLGGHSQAGDLYHVDNVVLTEVTASAASVAQDIATPSTVEAQQGRRPSQFLYMPLMTQ
ncbi:MAG: carbohydrate binding domain-containing protein [Chloroflexota bacterium]